MSLWWLTCVGYISHHSNLKGSAVDLSTCSSSHIQMSSRTESTQPHFRSALSVISPPGWFIICNPTPLLLLLTESLPYSPPPPLAPRNRPGVGGQRLPSDRNPGSIAVIWFSSDPCCALAVLPTPPLLSEAGADRWPGEGAVANSVTCPPPPEWNRKRRSAVGHF